MFRDVDEKEDEDDEAGKEDDARAPRCEIEKKPCEYFMTLPCTQVECERTFSKLRIVKSRLRSALKQQLPEPLLFMFVERELTFELNVDEIVQSFGRSSAELRRHLIE